MSPSNIQIWINSSSWWQLKYFWNFHPDPWGFMMQFYGHIFQTGGEKPHTSYDWGLLRDDGGE